MVKKRRLNAVSNKGKSRDRSPPSGDEVISARDRFKGALQHLLPHSEEESDSSEEDNWNSKKRLSLHRKKQQKNSETEKPSESESVKFQQSFVMKLFDRSVDLAQFNENTPLYPICRAWIANQPHQMYAISNVKSELNKADKDHEPYILKDDRDFDPYKDIHVLPTPFVQLKGGDTKLRIPEKIPYSTKYTSIQQDGVEPPSRDKLLKDNLKHWNKVRRSWLKAADDNEKRYECSIKVLSAMFNR